MGDLDRDEAVVLTGKSAADWMDALQDDDVVEALEGILGWAIELRRRVEPFGITADHARGYVVGAVLGGMRGAESDS